jgi:hypothetical protein
MAVVTKDGLLNRADLFMTILHEIGPLTRRRLLLSYTCRYQEQFTRRMVIPTDGWTVLTRISPPKNNRLIIDQ